ncbi:hypothetical protein LSTR_LSTR010696 [Laodelphax striatellus]|uniref:Odorant receptor n=1 Tax=Laodelphax striatellus TaxID=195883 RepID=A0A482WSJ1_LAOST|nr:hypothetical protein LSTR_LSTR010696 [Laodelphax striatellus]
MGSFSILRKYIALVRFDKPHNSIPFLIIMTIAALAVVNMFLVIMNEQNNTEKRLMGIKDLVHVTCAFSVLIKLSFNPKGAIQLVNFIENGCIVDVSKIAGRVGNWRRIEECYSVRRKSMRKMFKVIYYLIIIVYIGAVNRNLFSSLLGGTADTKNSLTPFVYWCPAGYDSFTYFTLIYIFHSVLLLFMAFQGFFIEVTVYLATEKVLADFETIFLLLDDIATNFSEIELMGETRQSDEELELYNLDSNLRRDMSLIVKCHQNFNRNFKDCADFSAYGILVNTFNISIDTVFNIYLMMKAEDLRTSINYGVASFLVNLLGFFRFHTGNKIVNQNDIFRQALANLPWTDKGQWFKKTMTIMMGRANINTEIKPYNIFVLDHKTYTSLMKSIFTYGNFLYTTSNPTE